MNCLPKKNSFSVHHAVCFRRRTTRAGEDQRVKAAYRDYPRSKAERSGFQFSSCVQVCVCVHARACVFVFV